MLLNESDAISDNPYRVIINQCSSYGNEHSGIAIEGNCFCNLFISNCQLKQNQIGMSIREGLHQRNQSKICISIDACIVQNHFSGIFLEKIQSTLIIQEKCEIFNNNQYCIFIKMKQMVNQLKFKNQKIAKKFIRGYVGGVWGKLEFKEEENLCSIFQLLKRLG